MGIFDFLKSGEKAPESSGPSANYVFAHVVLRGEALADPLALLSVMSSPNQVEFLRQVIERVVHQAGTTPSFGAEEINVHLRKAKDYPCIVLELPEPENLAEAHLIAVVVLVKLDAGFSGNKESVRARYFTLEKSITITNQPRTVFGEWRDNQHANYGDGPDPDVDPFIEMIEKYV